MLSFVLLPVKGKAQNCAYRYCGLQGGASEGEGGTASHIGGPPEGPQAKVGQVPGTHFVMHCDVCVQRVCVHVCENLVCMYLCIL